jgi:hypothetical protein
MEKIVHVKLSAAAVRPNFRTATRCTRCRPFATPLAMSSKSTGTRKSPASELTRLSNEAISVLRLAKESVPGISSPGPKAALGSVLAVAEMIQVREFCPRYAKLYHPTPMYQDMQSNKDDLAKLKLHLGELIKIDTSSCDGELKQHLTELALYVPLLEPQVQN